MDPSGFSPVANLIWGRQVHREIGKAFVRWTGGLGLADKSIKGILGFPIPGLSLFRPDLVDLRTGEIYEIKTSLGMLQGYAQIIGYEIILNLYDKQQRFWFPGESFQHPALPEEIDLGNGNVALVEPPLLGVIVYDVFSKQELKVVESFVLAGLAALAIKATLSALAELGLDAGRAVLMY